MALSRLYEEHVLATGSLDERIFTGEEASEDIGRKYVQEGSLASPLSSAMKSVGRLHTLLSGTKEGPSAKLAETLRYVSACLTSSLTLTLSTRLLSFRPGAAPETRATPSAGA